MRANILKVLHSCTGRQKVNHNLYPPQGKLVRLPVPERPWSSLGVDFIVKPLLSDGFDSMIVVINHYSKGAHFISAEVS
ncbi:hypothetical protein CROQUDRAFT_670173 [Cronartium quercuum f. sp. fusiforme G11]|uniref:Uncharacterized protein n=1 Tax=Cronartium quercuum f. sp. fusiforme G11 TaxID=708437 RepID=A0A9P6TES2_9BASI|nr:hypothetical protein CROQUDRAFT_670173 [Cronartium quercuum f. sp. fusiforme G11]